LREHRRTMCGGNFIDLNKSFEMKKIYLVLSLIGVLLFVAEAKAVGKRADVSGVVLDENGKPVDFATIGIFKNTDSSLVKTAVTNPDGKFTIPNMAVGTYYIKINMMGYHVYKSKTFNLDLAPLSLGEIKLIADSKTLKAVSVTAVKPMLERKADKLVMNVENSAVAVGSSALELLQRAPGVSVDQNDIISMQGKQGVMILLDGKQTYMSQADVSNLLRNMQSSEIESIELITNPSSKYDASGNSGVINIKTKRNKGGGANGSVNAGMAYGKNLRGNSGLNLNYRNKDANVFGSYNFGKGSRDNMLNIDRISNGTPDTYFAQLSDNHRNFTNNNFKVGVDFFLNKNNTLGFLVNSYINSGSEKTFTRTNMGSSFSTIDSLLNGRNSESSSYKNFSYNANYKSVLDTAGQEITFDFDYSKYNSDEDSRVNSEVVFPNGTLVRPSTYWRYNTPRAIDIKAARVDYTFPINKTTRLEAGAKSSWVETDNDLQATALIGSVWTNDPRKSNRFVYSENINAVYASLSKQVNKTKIQAGLRMEQTSVEGKLINTNEVVDPSYWDFFPTVYIQQDLAKDHQLGVSYGRRIDRPSYDALNPFIFYLDQYTYNKGNPFLQPQYTDNYEVSYTLMQKYFLTVGYSVVHDAITEVILPDESLKALYQTYANIATNTNLSASLNIPVKVRKWWNLNTNLSAFHLTFETPNLAGKSLKTGRTAYQVRIQNNFIIAEGFTAELNGNFDSPMTYGTLEIENRGFVDAGLSKTLLNKKATLRFAVSDVFDTNRTRLKSAYPGLRYNLYQKNETQLFRLSFNYRFGKNEIKPARRRTTSTEAEQGRMKN
jgi:5-hydroxyisourate hydrolase-like protein (transthyretin family)